MLEILFASGVLAVEIASVGDEFGRGDLPGEDVLHALVPPSDAIGELSELEGDGLGVVLPALGERLLIVPDVLRRPRAIEEEDIRWDAGVWRKHPVGQADDSVEVELLEQLFLNPGA